MKKSKTTLPIKLGAMIGLCLLFVFVYILNPSFWLEMWEVCLSGDMQRMVDYINSFGAWAMVFSFFLVLFVNAVGFPIGIIFSAANALVFGIIPGIILAWLAETVGVVLSFLLMRFMFRDAAEEIIAKHSSLQKIDDLSSEKGFRVMLVARLIPYLPSGLLNALGAISKMSVMDFTLSALIGKLPATAIEAMIGHDAVTAADNPYRLAFFVALAAAMIGAVVIYDRRQKKNQAVVKG